MAKKRNVIVVGNGLFGCVAATLARRRGHAVTVVSDNRPHAASRASGCVLAPTWLSSLSKAEVETAMGVLRELYDVQPTLLVSRLGARINAHRVNPDEILLKADVAEEVANVGDGIVTTASGTKLRGAVLVAAGVWCNNLVSMPSVFGLWGASLRVKGSQLHQARVIAYAPYKQAVAINLDAKTVWVGDGTSLVWSTWERVEASRIELLRTRASDLFGLDTSKALVRVGVRPSVQGHKAGYFAAVSPNTWVSTGGAKNGTVLAALQAQKFLEAL